MSLEEKKGDGGRELVQMNRQCLLPIDSTNHSQIGRWSELTQEDKICLATRLLPAQLSGGVLPRHELSLYTHQGKYYLAFRFSNGDDMRKAMDTAKGRSLAMEPRYIHYERTNMGPVPMWLTKEEVQTHLNTFTTGIQVLERCQRDGLERASFTILVPNGQKHKLREVTPLSGTGRIFFNTSRALRCPVCLSPDHTKPVRDGSNPCVLKCLKCQGTHKSSTCDQSENNCHLCETKHNGLCPKVILQRQTKGKSYASAVGSSVSSSSVSGRSYADVVGASPHPSNESEELRKEVVALHEHIASMNERIASMEKMLAKLVQDLARVPAFPSLMPAPTNALSHNQDRRLSISPQTSSPRHSSNSAQHSSSSSFSSSSSTLRSPPPVGDRVSLALGGTNLKRPKSTTTSPVQPTPKKQHGQ